MSRHEFDLIVIGSGPAGQKAAIQAAKLGRRAAIIERKRVVGLIGDIWRDKPSARLAAELLAA